MKLSCERGDEPYMLNETDGAMVGVGAQNLRCELDSPAPRVSTAEVTELNFRGKRGGVGLGGERARRPENMAFTREATATTKRLPASRPSK